MSERIPSCMRAPPEAVTTTSGTPLDRRSSGDESIAQAGRDLGLGEALRVGAQVEEPERVGGAEARVLLDERALIGDLRDPLTRTHREVVAALRTHPERLLELLISVVRLALGARVRMLRALALRGRAALLDRHVDPTRHRAYLTGPPPYHPSAPAKPPSGPAVSGPGGGAGTAAPN